MQFAYQLPLIFFDTGPQCLAPAVPSDGARPGRPALLWRGRGPGQRHLSGAAGLGTAAPGQPHLGLGEDEDGFVGEESSTRCDLSPKEQMRRQCLIIY